MSALLPEIVQRCTVAFTPVPPKTENAPPTPLRAEFPMKEQSVVASVPLREPPMSTAPPLTVAMFPEKVQLIKVSASSTTKIAPPELELLPSLNVRSRTVTAVPVAADDVLKIRLAPLPEIFKVAGPGPSTPTAPL